MFLKQLQILRFDFVQLLEGAFQYSKLQFRKKNLMLMRSYYEIQDVMNRQE